MSLFNSNTVYNLIFVTLHLIVNKQHILKIYIYYFNICFQCIYKLHSTAGVKWTGFDKYVSWKHEIYYEETESQAQILDWGMVWNTMGQELNL